MMVYLGYKVEFYRLRLQSATDKAEFERKLKSAIELWAAADPRFASDVELHELNHAGSLETPEPCSTMTPDRDSRDDYDERSRRALEMAGVLPERGVLR